MEPEIWPKMFKKLIEKFGAKFPVTTQGYSMVKIAHLDDTFPEILELEASPVEGQTQQQKGKKRRKVKGEKIKTLKFRFLPMPEQKCGKTQY